MKENDLAYWNNKWGSIAWRLDRVNAKKRQMEKDLKECADNIARLKLILAEKIRRCK